MSGKEEDEWREARVDFLMEASRGFDEYDRVAELRARLAVYRRGGYYILIVVLLALLVLVTVYAEYSSILRWAIGIVGILLISVVASHIVAIRTEDPLDLSRKGRAEIERMGDLKHLSDVLKRAQLGMRYSQLEFSERVRAAFLEKVMISRNLSRDELAAIMRDAAKLQELIGDEEIVNFIIESEKDSSNWAQILKSKGRVLEQFVGEERFLSKMSQLVRKMEEWH